MIVLDTQAQPLLSPFPSYKYLNNIQIMIGIFDFHTLINKTNIEDIFVLDGMCSMHYINIKLNNYIRKSLVK